MNKNKLLAMVITGGLILTFSFNTFADETNSSNKKAPVGSPGIMKIHDGDRFENNFEQWVEEGIISQEQADKWKEYTQIQAEERKAEMEKIKDMTEEERKAYFEERKTERTGDKKDLFSNIVEKGIISQQQADQIKEKMPQRDESIDRNGHRNSISQWVEKGIISQEEADKWEEYNQEKAKERKAEMEKIKAMTDEERKAYFEERKEERIRDKKDFLGDIVEEGIITQEQADQIKEAMQEQFKRIKK